MLSEKQIEELIKSTIRKNRTELNMALVKPISSSYPFSTNGNYFFIGMPGSGKTFKIWKHILTCEKMFKKPVYSLIVFCSTSGKMDKTSEALRPNITTPIKYITDEELLPWLTKHLKRKSKYYSMVKHVLSKLQNTDEKMAQLIQKHSLDDIEDRIVYIAQKLVKYDTVEYPFNTLLILDDFAGHPLTQKTNSPLNRLLTKNRHNNLTCIIAIQTHIWINRNLKRIATDMVIYAGYSREDMETMLTQIPNNLNKKEIIDSYLNLKNPNDYLQINIIANRHEFVINTRF